jgi:hypothetical protein
VGTDFFVRRWAYRPRTAQGQIITKIELGVKVITNEGAVACLFPETFFH